MGKCFAALLLCSVGLSARVRAEDTTCTFPIHLHSQHIYMDAKINGQPVTMVLDSGAGVNIVTPAAAAKLHLKTAPSPVRAVGAGGAPVELKMATLESLQTGTLSLANQMAFALELPQALRCDGLLGTPFFQKYVISIDYAAKTLTLTSPDKFLAPTDSEVKELPLDTREQTIHIHAKMDGVDGLLSVDTGASDNLTLFAPFVAANHLRESYDKKMRMVTGRGVGGMVYGDLVRLKSLDIADFHFSGVITSLSIQKQGAFASSTLAGNLGAEVLQRFTVTIDEPHKRMFLKKNANFSQPFIGNRSGLGVDFDMGKLTVQSVFEGSPAEKAGVRVGDVIISVEGKPVNGDSLEQIRTLFRAPSGTVIHMVVQTPTGETLAKALTLIEQL
jgi:predicted aspartyl protease